VLRLVTPAVREVFRREKVPVALLWLMTARGMIGFMRLVEKELRPALGGDAKPAMARIAAQTFERRYDHLRNARGWLPAREADPRAPALLFAALYGVGPRSRAAWIFDDLGGAPKTLRERARAEALAARFGPRARWEELTIHLGEWLIVLTEDLPRELPRARALVADICFRAGVEYAEQAARRLGVPTDGDRPARAIEVLRMTEYLFRVNPSHWGGSDGTTGWLEGTACPWWDRPGWGRGHCGIFGQFQAGVASVFGLRYQLTETIPKHGGTTCRIDLHPIGVRLGRNAGAASVR
jgi:hypothetical protein